MVSLFTSFDGRTFRILRVCFALVMVTFMFCEMLVLGLEESHKFLDMC